MISGVASGHDNARRGPRAGPAVLDAAEEGTGRLSRQAHDRTFPAGAVLTVEEEGGTSFGVIVEGQAAVSVHGRPARTLSRHAESAVAS